VSNPRDGAPLFSFAIIADTHITDEEGLAIDGSHATGEKVSSLYRDLVARVNDMDPAFVVHLGDITHPTPVSPDYGDAAEAFHKASEVFAMPFYLVPGNHDIGEKIHPALPRIDDEVSITKRAMGLYEQHFGRQRYSFQHNDCLFLVINTMLLNSGLEEEQEQWDWLEQTLYDNAERRMFIFAHYPLYLSQKDEPPHYDNVDEPARSRLLAMLAPYPVEGYYAGHVHNFFYNHLNGMHQFVLPSTSIIRHDYQEFFRASPTREMGRFDQAKTGFFWIDVYDDGHVPYLIRTNNDHPYRTHPWGNTACSVTMDLRMPWCDEADVSTPWAVEIFERKHVRNDYPLSALWEMGISDLRIPISDILDSRVSKRVTELAGLGHRFTVIMFGIPNEERRAALRQHSDCIKAIEVVALFSDWPALIEPLTELRDASDFHTYLHPVRPEVEGWTTHHGMHADRVDEVEWVLDQSTLADAVDGFVFQIKPNVHPCDGYAAVERCLVGTDYRPLLHVPCVGFDRTSAPSDDKSRLHELARVAEAVMLARAYPQTTIVIDNFVELDRGYFNCRGLVDRFYNPKDGSRIITSLDSLLPNQIKNLTSEQSSAGRVIHAESNDGVVMLILPNALAGQSEPQGDFAEVSGNLTNLTTGETLKTSFGGLSNSPTAQWQTPLLLIQDQA
jgi:3',5'-cyclic AMP phosphodiesterase CpdA